MNTAVPSLDTTFLKLPLSAAAMTPSVASGYRRLVDDAHGVLDEQGVPRDGRRTWIVPGRIEVLGKHTDYAGGRSLLCTVSRGIALVARPVGGNQSERDPNGGSAGETPVVTVHDARRRERLRITPRETSDPALPWAVYPHTVVSRLALNFGSALRSADIGIASNLPPAAGVSSSSAFVVGLTLALSALSELDATDAWRENIPDRAALAGYAGALESGIDFGTLRGERGVGTMSGAQDQTAILCCAPGQLDVFAWTPVRHERTVPWPAGYTFVIGVSGVVASKTGAAKERYNRAARTVQRLVEAWNAHESRGERVPARVLAHAFEQASGTTYPVDVPGSLADAARRRGDGEFSSDALVARLEQFHGETYRIIPDAASALADGRLVEFGELVSESQAGAEAALENQVPETRDLVRFARELGATAASAFGAGFGGSTWAMIESSDADEFAQAWRDRYASAHAIPSRRAQFFPTVPSAPVFEVIGG